MSHIIPNTKFLVTHADEISSSGLRAHIPTFGQIASAVDVYRIVAIHSVENQPNTWSMLDLDAQAALGRLVAGPIHGADDFVKAEMALRASLLSDFVDVFVPCVKIHNSNGFIAYKRFDKSIRDDAAYAALSCVPTRDVLFASEFLQVRDGEFIASSLSASGLLGRDLEDNLFNFEYALSSTRDVMQAWLQTLNMEAHLTSPLRQFDLSSYLEKLYQKMNEPWIAAQLDAPKIGYEIPLPVFVTIVLNRINKRDEIPLVFKELREEMAVVRSELASFKRLGLEEGLNQAEYVERLNQINSSFDAIVPKALSTKRQKRAMYAQAGWHAFKPLSKQLFSLFAGDFSSLYDRFHETLEGFKSSNDLLRNPIYKTSCAPKFAELLTLEDSTTRSLLKRHFSETELRF